MIRPRAGLLIFSESLVREDVYRKRKPISDREVARFEAKLAVEADVVRPEAGELRSKRQAAAAIRELASKEIDAVILYVPIFIAPALVAHTASQLAVPLALACNEAPDSLSQLAYLAAAGAMDQLGLKYLRVPGDAASDECFPGLVSFLRAAAAKTRLRGQTFGCIGGRSLGISTGTADLALWERLFGVDIEHIDQFDIVRRAEAASQEVLDAHMGWLRERAGLVQFNDSNFTLHHLEKQVRSYLATRDIILDYELDFLGIKCQPEMSNHYCLQCVNVSICNDPYDADGAKEPMACSCEADADGALTMQVLKLLSGGQPVNLNDIASLSASEMTLANCGAMATYYAALGRTPEENLSAVNLVPHSFGAAGGAAVRFTVPAGIEMTFARLFRRADRYVLGFLTGKTVMKDRAAQSATIQTRPLIFVSMNVDKTRLMQSFGSNHIHGIQGNYKRELKAFAELLGLESIDYDLN
jgi:L-fucose/D-arabinose isomerase